jgi:hypothetical protein
MRRKARPTPQATDVELEPWCNSLWPLVHVRLLLDTYPMQGVTPTMRATGKSVEAVRKKAYQMGLRMDATAISESNRRAALFSWRHKARKPRGQAARAITGAFASIWAVAAACTDHQPPPRQKSIDMTNLQLIESHLRAAVLGEAMPSFRDAGMTELFAAISATTEPTMAPGRRYHDLAQIGLVALALLNERATTSMKAERELAQIAHGGTR